MASAGTVSSGGGAQWPAVCVVGPLPPPSGGMANQCEQLVRLLRADGVSVELVCTNPPYRPRWIGSLPVLRAGFRLLPYLLHLWRAIGRAAVVHVLANSGWAWHLFAAPAIVVARWRDTPVIINYRGGNADSFLARAPRHVRRLLAAGSLRVTPSVFLQRVFAKYGLSADVVPNIIDLSRFAPVPRRSFGDAPHLVVTRNLEEIYDIPTALRAFVRIRTAFPQAQLTVAGSGPEGERLQALAGGLGPQPHRLSAGAVDGRRQWPGRRASAGPGGRTWPAGQRPLRRPHRQRGHAGDLRCCRLHAQPEHRRQHAEFDPRGLRQWRSGCQYRCRRHPGPRPRRGLRLAGGGR